METSVAFSCIACGNKELCFGYLGNSTANVFVPSNMFTIHGYRIRSYVCLKCGHVELFMPQDRLEKLKEKYNERFNKIETSV